MKNQRIYALTTKCGTACAETALCSEEYTEEMRRRTEAEYCHGNETDPVAGTWCDCTDNDALRDMFDESALAPRSTN